LIDAFAARLATDRQFLPFSADGRALLLAALSDERMPTLHFAFGTSADAIARLNEAGVDVDIVSYFTTTTPALRDRQTNTVTSVLDDDIRIIPPRPTVAAQEPPAPSAPPVQSREQIKSDPLAIFGPDDDELLTPREMWRRQHPEATPQPEQKPDSPLAWLGHLLARLLGRG
jgi:hypothetical protein